jgi:hypothetical protein
MYSNARRSSETIARQRKVIEEQEGIIALLKGALAAASSEPVPIYKAWMGGLTPQEQALLGALFRHYPNPVGGYALLDLIPGQDHVQERQVQLVAVKIHDLRKKLGGQAIETVRGAGYRLGRAQHEAMRDDAPTEAFRDGGGGDGPRSLLEQRRAA